VATGHYERLSGLDNSFLLLESRTTYMHIAVTAVFEPGTLVRPGGGLDIDALRRHVASRLDLIPRYRQRLTHIPLVQEPVWVDDDDFDLTYHVRHSSLPKPGGDAELRRLCARILERHLDRARPLWEIWFIEGLEGDRFAMLSKVHHCMVDGIAGVDLLAALLGAHPQPPEPVAADAPRGDGWTPRPVPSDAQLVREEVLRRARGVTRLLGSATSLLRQAAQTPPATVRSRAAALGQAVRRALDTDRVPLPFNDSIGPHRRVAWLSFDLARVKAIKDALGGSLNDVVLAVVAGGLRSFLAMRGMDPDRLAHVRAAVPVSVRGNEDGAAGNRVSAWIVALPISESDAWRRLTAVRVATDELKRSGVATGVQAITEVAELGGSNLLGWTLRVAGKMRPYDVVVTNVPGPPMPFYLMDAPMALAYPHLPLFERQGLGIALLSYAGRLSWGLIADWQLVPDLDELAGAVERAFDELLDTAALVAAAAAAEPDGRACGRIAHHVAGATRTGNDSPAQAEPADLPGKLRLVRGQTA